MIGKSIIHYQILEELGRGGMGIVYKARDTKLNRLVALKFLPSDSIKDKNKKARMLQEAQAAASINHPNICTVYEVDALDDQVFIAMEYIDGKNLKEIINEKSALDISKSIGYAIQIAEGLQAIHDQGMVHRDIKSDNIRITKNGQVKIMDFGLVKLSQQKEKLTQEDSTLGTVDYMSPEQIRGEKIDKRTDIWSFGVVMYEMFNGELPFKGENGAALIYAILDEEPENFRQLNPDIPDFVENIVKKALSKESVERYQSIQEILSDLKELNVDTSGNSQIGRSPVKTSRKSLIRYVVFTFILLVTIFLVFFIIEPTEESSIDSIAVLPLVDMSQSSQEDWFADQMTDIL